MPGVFAAFERAAVEKRLLRGATIEEIGGAGGILRVVCAVGAVIGSVALGATGVLCAFAGTEIPTASSPKVKKSEIAFIS